MKRLPRTVRIGDQDIALGANAKGDGEFQIRVGNQSIDVRAGRAGTGAFWFHLADGTRHVAWATTIGDDLQVRVDGRTWVLPSSERTHAKSSSDADPSRIVAPMTGTIVRVLVSVGDTIEENQDLVILSAMKIEHRLRTTIAGVVTEVHANEGDTVEADELLVVCGRR